MLCIVSQSALYMDKSQDLCSTSDFMTLSIHKHPLSDLHPLWFTISAISSESGVFHVLCISNRYVIVRPSDDLLFKSGGRGWLGKTLNCHRPSNACESEGPHPVKPLSSRRISEWGWTSLQFFLGLLLSPPPPNLLSLL